MITVVTKVRIRHAMYNGGYTLPERTGTIVGSSDIMIELETPEGNIIINMQHIWSIEEVKE